MVKFSYQLLPQDKAAAAVMMAIEKDRQIVGELKENKAISDQR